jgi:hypothetical protein
VTRWHGDPGGAAMAAAQLEFLARSYRENPIWAPGTSIGTLTALAAGRRDMRAWLGIGEGAPALAVETQLRAASVALREGHPGLAEAALSGPDFTLGAAETLRRLADPPRIPAVAWAAGAVGEEIARRSWPRT